MTVVAVLGVPACDTSPPTPPSKSPLADAGAPAYADLIVSYSENGIAETCTESIPSICQVQEGPCAGHPVLGAPDSVTHQLVDEDTIEVGFLCNPIIDRAVDSNLSPDFRVLAVVQQGQAVVSASQDGSTFFALGNLNTDNQSFDLANEQLDFARFVQIAGEPGAVIVIDAVEVIP